MTAGAGATGTVRPQCREQTCSALLLDALEADLSAKGLVLSAGAHRNPARDEGVSWAVGPANLLWMWTWYLARRDRARSTHTSALEVREAEGATLDGVQRT